VLIHCFLHNFAAGGLCGFDVAGVGIWQPKQILWALGPRAQQCEFGYCVQTQCTRALMYNLARSLLVMLCLCCRCLHPLLYQLCQQLVCACTAAVTTYCTANQLVDDLAASRDVTGRRRTQGVGDDALQLWVLRCRCPDQRRDVLADVPAPAQARTRTRASPDAACERIVYNGSTADMPARSDDAP
jgi:hypothetical protein